MEYFNLINSRNKIVNGIIILCAIIISYNIYNKQAQGIAVLKQSKELELKKNDVLREIILSENRITTYKHFVNNKDISSIIYKLHNIANDSGVLMKSIKPLDIHSYPVYVSYPYVLSVSARTYADLGKFISMLENSPDVYLIESTSISPVFKGDDPLPESITVGISLYTILFK